MACSPTEPLLAFAGDEDGAIHLWGVWRGQSNYRQLPGHTGQGVTVAPSRRWRSAPDGKTLASSGQDKRVGALWKCQQRGENGESGSFPR